MAMRASILVGVHNEGDRLWRTVESIFETKGKLDAEVLVADDGSTDGSIKELNRHFPGVSVLEHKKRIGVGATRGLAASRARGEVLIFLDGHTKPEPGTLERLVTSVEKTRGEAVITPQIVGLDETTWRSQPQQIGHGYALDLETFDSWWLPLKKMVEVKESRQSFFESPALVGCAVAVSRELYDRLWGFDADMRQWGNEDLDFALKAWTMGARVLHDPGATVAHRFQRQFADYEVSADYPLANQIRSARKHFTQSAWEDWLVRAQQQQRLRLKDHPEGLWASAWEVFQHDRQSAEHERSYLLSRRVHDEFWFARKFNRSWPNMGGGPTLLTQAPLPPHVLFAQAMGTPQVESIAPDQACSGVGRLTGIVITGNHLSGTSVTGSGPIAVTSATVVSDTEIDATFNIGAFEPGTYDITVSNSVGSDSGQFTVNPMTVTGIDPESGCAGASVDVTITGTCFLSSSNPPTITGTGVTTSSVTLVDGQTITATVEVDSGATSGTVELTVANSNGEGDSDNASFTVNGVTGIDPESGAQGTTVSITISGYGLSGATLSNSDGVTFANVVNSSDTSITADMTIPNSVSTGQIDITVTEADGCQDTAQFTVNARRLILLLGYWPPTDTADMLSDYVTQQQYYDSNGNATAYDILAISASYTQQGTWGPPGAGAIPFFGAGTGNFPVDYQTTSEDFWSLVPDHNPAALLSFSWEPSSGTSVVWILEYQGRNLANPTPTPPSDYPYWRLSVPYYPTGSTTPTTFVQDPPYQGGAAGDPALPNAGLPTPTYGPPDATQAAWNSSAPSSNNRLSSLPVSSIINAINAQYPGVAELNLGYAGGYDSEFIAYHVAWYQEWKAQTDPTSCYCAGHTHVTDDLRSNVGLAKTYLQLQIDAVIANSLP